MTQQLEMLLAQLQSADAHARSEAVLALGKQREVGAVSALVGVLCHDVELNVQEDATWSLVRMGDVAVEPLLKALSHYDAKVRHNVVHTLGKIGDVRALDALILATQDADSKVRYKAVYALGQLKNVRAIPALIVALGDSVQDVAWMARDTLEGFGAKAELLLIEALSAESVQVRELVTSLLGNIGSENTVDALLLALKTDNWEVRFAILQALGEIGDVRALPEVERLTSDADQRVGAMARAMMKMLKSG